MSSVYGKLKSARTEVIMVMVLALVMGMVAAIIYSVLWRRSASVQSRNIVLIVLDTVRIDRLGCYGNQAGITPEIDRFADGAVRFEKAFSHAPWTLPSVASLFTSRYPVQHGAGGRLGAFRILNDQAVTIAEVFQGAGVVTGAITNVLFLTEKFGMMQGFDTVDASVPKNNTSARRARETTDATLGWLDQHRGKPFFLFVHYFDPHLTYDPPQPFRKRFADAKDAKSNNYLFGTVRDMIKFRRGLAKLDPEIIKRLEKLHNGEVAYVDYEVGRLLDGISQRGLDHNTIIVLTSDHGEEFGDHGGFEHGHTLYDELLHVPLIIRIPGIHPEGEDHSLSQAAVTVNTTVRQIDIVPTLCELVGISPDPIFEGKSLVPLMRGQKENHRPVLSQGNMWGPSATAWRKNGLKLIRRSSTGPYQLFDINADSQERNDLSDQTSERYADMVRDFELILGSISAQVVSGKSPSLTEEQIQRLRSLGYLN